MKWLTPILLLIVSLAQAQKKPVYTAAIEGGMVKGNNGTNSVYFFSNSIRYNNLTAGLGAGIDNYLLRSVPLYIDLRKDFGHRSFQPFVSYSAGINIEDGKPQQKQIFGYYTNPDAGNGFYTKAMIGASVRLYKDFRVFAGFGYSYKTTKVSYDMYNYTPDEHIEKGQLVYKMNRWSLTAGFRF